MNIGFITNGINRYNLTTNLRVLILTNEGKEVSKKTYQCLSVCCLGFISMKLMDQVHNNERGTFLNMLLVDTLGLFCNILKIRNSGNLWELTLPTIFFKTFNMD